MWAFTVLMVLAIFLPSALPAIPHPDINLRFREGVPADRSCSLLTVVRS